LRALLRRATRYPLPVYLTLNNIVRDNRPGEEHLAAAMADAGFSHSRAFLARKLQRGECMLLLDALDEVAERGAQQRVLAKINRLQHSYGAGNQVLVTSRIAGFPYSLNGYLQLEVQELDQAQVERFVRSRRIDGLLRGLARSPRMQLLASNPLLLSLITLLYEQNWRLPERRVELYEECAALLIEKWDEIRGITRAPRFAPEQKRQALVGIAVHFHEAGTRVFEQHALFAALTAVLPRDDGDGESSTEFLEELMAHTGLLRQKSRSTYDFVHLTFQEFFTACAYQESGDTEGLLGHLGEAWWREVIRLYAALAHDATLFLKRLAEEDAILAAECLADCRTVHAPAFRRAAEAIVEDLQRRVREDADRRQEAADALAAEIGGWGSTEYLRAAVTEREHHPESALAALLAFARAANAEILDTLTSDLGSSLRFLHAQLPVVRPSLRPRILSLLARLGHPLLFVPAGEFLIGDDGRLANQRPGHAVTLSEYWIDKYPVTNEQYARFAQETGHENDEWRKAFTPGKERHTVVNVNWDDAHAYGKWCGKRLPSEAEWEKATRGTDGRIYPWGNAWDGNKCNISGRGTTPVGHYPQGISPYGCHDMSGNVQERVADWYAPDYYAHSPASNPRGPRLSCAAVFGTVSHCDWD
jgi:formylglycine-generating enzyme required for sulfatase activity